MMSDDKEPLRIEGAQFLCEVPRALGRVKKIRIRNDKVMVETEGGIQMIVPVIRVKRS